MTNEEMDQDVADAQTYLSVTSLRVDRCRHASVSETALWVFDGEKQIASISRCEPTGWDRDLVWNTNRMSRGLPVSNRYHRTLLDAIGDVMRAEPAQ